MIDKDILGSFHPQMQVDVIVPFSKLFTLRSSGIEAFRVSPVITSSDELLPFWQNATSAQTNKNVKMKKLFLDTLMDFLSFKNFTVTNFL
jgi:hypothetical protein